METNNNGFIKYHLPCPLCSSSDAVSMNKDGSAYCFSCQEYIKEYRENPNLSILEILGYVPLEKRKGCRSGERPSNGVAAW